MIGKLIAKLLPQLLPKLMPNIFKQLMPELKPLQKYVYEKNDLDEKVDVLISDKEKMEKQIEALTMTCKAMDTKIDEVFKLKKKFK